MPEMNPARPRVVSAILGPKPEYIEIVDWDGKSLTFLLADEIRLEEKRGLRTTEEDRKSPS